ncbi:MAG: hypothetical protein AB1649_26810 [Chloroflexota bacterium]
MILYEKKFRLGDGIAFPYYIKTLDQMAFSPYTLRIHEIPDTQDFHIEIELTSPINAWGRMSPFAGWALLKECTVKYLQDENSFTLQASTGSGSFLKALVFLVKLFLLLLMILSAVIMKDTTGELLAFVFIILLFSPPSVLMYIREIALLDRIGTIGSELQKG